MAMSCVRRDKSQVTNHGTKRKETNRRSPKDYHVKISTFSNRERVPSKHGHGQTCSKGIFRCINGGNGLRCCIKREQREKTSDFNQELYDGAVKREHIFGKMKKDRNKRRSVDSDESLFMCTHCNAALNSALEMYVHFKRHNSEEPYTCTCGKRFRKKQELTKHSALHKCKPLDNCRICGDLSSNLKKHMLSHREEKRYECKKCPRVFRSKTYFKRHQEKHAKEAARPRCNICSAVFQQDSELQDHQMMMHYREKPYTCQFCSEPFTHPHNLAAHQMTHANDESQSLQSKTLKKSRSKDTTQPHTSEEDALKCSYYSNQSCTSDFTEEKPYQCLICSQVLWEPLEYNAHMAQHAQDSQTAEPRDSQQLHPMEDDITGLGQAHIIASYCCFKPPVTTSSFCCSFCPKIFGKSILLRCHQLLSHRRLRYACAVCGLVFSAFSGLQMHALTHNGGGGGGSVHYCRRCGQYFLHAWALAMHRNTYHTAL